MKKYKVLINICSVLLLICIGCAVIGYIQKGNNKPNNTPIENNTVMEKDPRKEENNTVVEQGEKYPNFCSWNYEEKKQELENFTQEHNIELEINYNNNIDCLKGIICRQNYNTTDVIKSGQKLVLTISDNEYFIEDVFNGDYWIFDDIGLSEEEKGKLNLKDEDTINSSDNKYVSISRNDSDDNFKEAILVDRKSFKTKKTEKRKKDNIFEYVFKNGFVLLIEKDENSDIVNCKKVYTTDLKELVSNAKSLLFVNENLAIISGTTITVYDSKGNVKNKISNIISFKNNYTLIKENDTYKIVSLTNKKYDLIKDNGKLDFDDMYEENQYIYIDFLDKSIKKADYTKYCEDNSCDDSVSESNKYGRYFSFDVDNRIIDTGLKQFEKSKQTVKYSNKVNTIGILMKGYDPFINLQFQKEINYLTGGEMDGKVIVKTDKIEYQDFHGDGKKKSINAPGVEKAAILCDCGVCDSFLYIDLNNDLYFIENDDGKITTTKIGSKMQELASVVEYVDVFPSTCGYNIVAVKDIDGNIYIFDANAAKLYSKKDVERNFVTLAGIDTEEDDWGSWKRIIYIMSENAKADAYLLDENKKTLSAKAIVLDNDSIIYVISEDDYIYIFDSYIYDNKGTKYSNVKVESYSKSENGLNITYSDGSSELISGAVYIK